MDQSLILNRNEDLDAVKTQLLSNTHQTNNRKNAPVVAIVGMGGLGKTTLAQLLYNDSNVKDYFPTRAWVCVSNDFNVERLSKEILESTSGSACKLENLDQIQRKLEERLGGNRFLLVLDDVWSEKPRDWEALRVPFRIAEKGSRIIVTTRSRKTVSSIRDTIYAHDLQILSNESCWELIKRRAFAEETMLSVEPGLEAIGREVAKKCKGLPLAASTIGSLLYSSKPDVEEWENILQSDMWNSEGDDELPASLSLSYHYLPLHLKHCFAYCSLFPKDHEFDKKHLVQMWIAEGFVLPAKQDKRLLGAVGAGLVSGEIYCRIGSSGKYSFEISKNTRHLSLPNDEEHLRNVESAHESKCLSTLMVGIIESAGWTDKENIDDILNSMLPKKAPVGLWENLRCLRVLSLSGAGINEIPESIGNLKHLRYINLSSFWVTELPESICKLYHLEILIQDDCLMKMARLPQGIGRLSCLKTMPHFPVAKDGGGAGLGELKGLQCLEGALCIHGLHNVSNVAEATEVNLRDRSRIHELELCFGDGPDLFLELFDKAQARDVQSDKGMDAEVLEALQPHTELRRLEIDRYCGDNFPPWMMNGLSRYRKLVSVRLGSCYKCRSLPPLGQLPLLESLTLEWIVEVEEWPGAESGEFLCLQRLKIINCQKLRQLHPALGSIPKLSLLKISGCPGLTSLPNPGLINLTSLKDLTITDCSDTLKRQLLDEGFPLCLTHLEIDSEVLMALPSRGLRDLSCLEELELREPTQDSGEDISDFGYDLSDVWGVQDISDFGYNLGDEWGVIEPTEDSRDLEEGNPTKKFLPKLPTNLRRFLVNNEDCTHYLHSQERREEEEIKSPKIS
uniref:Disease resistance RPP13-like protein 1 n=1 Tax=Nelumbo nucifera TaxID=4432 RepID=A0A822YQV2_NELNU|nr:TPA_asm: hypothetical protein HUJ06_007215 [Nelumbo nucifera]